MSAESVNSVASWVFIFSLVLGVVSSILIMITGKIKDQNFKLELSQNSIELGETMFELNKTKLDVEQAKLETANVNKTAKIAELELEKLRAKMRSRSLTVKQREILISSLSKLSGKEKIPVHSISDKEASEYAEQIISVLVDANIGIIKSTSGIVIPPKYGLIVSSSSNFSEFRNAFKKANIDFTTSDAESGILIGLKPPIDP